MNNLSHLTPHQRNSYLAGMIDHAGNVKPEVPRLYVKSKNKKQILEFQQLFGGEIHKAGKDTYEMRYKATKIREILPLIGPYLKKQVERFQVAAAKVRIQFGSALYNERFYTAGANDAKRSDEPFDESILSKKNADFYQQKREEAKRDRLAKELAEKTAKATEKKTHKDTERYKINERKRLRRERFADLRLPKNLIKSFEWDQKEWMDCAEQHDLWWAVAYRDSKECTICGFTLPLTEFGKDYAKKPTIDGLKHSCKKCCYNQYVRPKLPQLNERVKKWNKENPDKVRVIRNKQNKKPMTRIKKSLSMRVRELIGSKEERTSELIGCAKSVLRTHLESQFVSGMTWDNYGEWHIDHIIPCRAFNLFVKEERLKCFNYANLRPTWGKENVDKSDTLPDGRRARDVFPKWEPVELPNF